MNSADTSEAGEPPPLEDRLPAELGPDLQLIRPIGRGSVARVFLCREKTLRRLVAVKVLDPERAADETTRRRFEREGRAAATVSHPNVVVVYRVGRLSDGVPYIVMQYVKGRSLDERLAAGPVGQADAVRILVQLSSALAAAHERGIVHRDVRPGNILFEEASGRCLLTDFGIAAIQPTGDEYLTRLTRTDEKLGDPGFASPEQLSGDPVTERADVYSLAVVGYHLFVGRGPYDAETPEQLAIGHLRSEPRPIREFSSTVPAELEDLLLRCLDKSAGRRPNAADVRSRLEALEAQLDQTTPSTATVAVKPGGAEREPTPAPVSSHEAEVGEEPSGGLMAEIRDRRVPHIVGAFFAFGLAALETLDQLENQELAPALAYELWLVFFLVGLVASGVLAWFHGQRGPQRIEVMEVWILGFLALVWLVVSAIVLVR